MMQARDQKFYTDLETTLKGRLRSLDSERTLVHKTAETFGITLEGEDQVQTHRRRSVQTQTRRTTQRRSSGYMTYGQAKAAIYDSVRKGEFKSLGWAMRTHGISETVARRAMSTLLENGSLTRREVGYNNFEYQAADQLVA